MRLYLAHAASDRTIAAFLKTELERLASGISVFVASRPGDIPTGSDWLKEIHGNLRLADAFLFLLTPRSVERPWVWYEAGAAWFSDKRRIHVATAGLDRGDIPYPLGAIQTLQIDPPVRGRGHVGSRPTTEHAAPGEAGKRASEVSASTSVNAFEL